MISFLDQPLNENSVGKCVFQEAGGNGIRVNLSTAKIACIPKDIVNHEAHE